MLARAIAPALVAGGAPASKADEPMSGSGNGTNNGNTIPKAFGLHDGTSISLMRIVGYSLYSAWVLVNFYNTFMLNESGDYRALLYLNMIVSMAALSLTLLVFPHVVKRADKWVLSKSCIGGSGIAMAIATALIVPASMTNALGMIFTLIGAIVTGVSSGVLFLGWGRLFSDVGSHGAMLEMSAAWLLAAGIDVGLTLLPSGLSIAIVIVIAIASAILLRVAVMSRPHRPIPTEPLKLHKRTKRLFTRASLAFFAIGMVAGLCDMLAGFRFIPVPHHYELMLALCVAVVSAVILVIALSSKHAYVLSVRRFTSMFLMIGCALVPFMPMLSALPSILVFGAYQGIGILLCVVCIDLSNQFDQPACRMFGRMFGAMYAGEVIGDLVCLTLTEYLHLDMGGLLYVSSALSVIVAFLSLFLFTDTDLLETGLGEMVDDEEDKDDKSLEIDSSAQSPTVVNSSAGRLSIDQVSQILADQYGLTPREAEVLPLVLRGRTIARIQEELHISQGTVSTHTRHIYQKVGCHNRQGLLDLAEKIMSRDKTSL